MQLFLLFVQVKLYPTLYAAFPKGHPFLQNFPYAHDTGNAMNQNVKVAGIAVLKRCQAEQFLHHLLRISTTLQVNGQLQSVPVCLVPDIGNLSHFALLDDLYNFVLNGFNGGAVWNFCYFNTAVCLIIIPFCPDFDAAASRFVNLFQFFFLIQQEATAWEIRPF